jgi:hypothetical protein
MMGVDGEQLEGPDERHGYERDTGTNRNVGGPSHKSLYLPILGAATFWKDEEGHACLERPDGTIEPG